MPIISRFLGIIITMYWRIMRRRTFTPNTASTKLSSPSKAELSKANSPNAPCNMYWNGWNYTSMNYWKTGNAAKTANPYYPCNLWSKP